MIDTIKTAVIGFIIHYPHYPDDTIRKPDEKSGTTAGGGPGSGTGYYAARHINYMQCTGV